MGSKKSIHSCFVLVRESAHAVANVLLPIIFIVACFFFVIPARPVEKVEIEMIPIPCLTGPLAVGTRCANG